MEKCSNCEGTGKIKIDCVDSPDAVDWDGAGRPIIECPVCNGKGYTGTDEDK